MNLDKKHKGQLGEQYVEDFLISRGYRVLQKNCKIQGVEIDLIVMKKNSVTLLEIKNHFYVGSGFEKLIDQKQVDRLQKVFWFLKRKYYSHEWAIYLVHLQKDHDAPKFYQLV